MVQVQPLLLISVNNGGGGIYSAINQHNKGLIALAVSEGHTAFTLISNGLSTQQVTVIMQIIDPILRIRLFITIPLHHNYYFFPYFAYYPAVYLTVAYGNTTMPCCHKDLAQYYSSDYVLHNLMSDLFFLLLKTNAMLRQKQMCLC